MVDAIEHFKTAMADVGMIVKDPIIADDVLHRCHVEGDKPCTKNGAYIKSGFMFGCFFNHLVI